MSYDDRYGKVIWSDARWLVKAITPGAARERLYAIAEDPSLYTKYANMLRVVLNEGTPLAWLPHQCNEWVIGGPEEVRRMIADLQAALAVMEGGA